MVNSTSRGAADDTTSVAADGARKGVDGATGTARKVAGGAQEPTQHAVEEWTRGVKEGLTRDQETSWRRCASTCRRAVLAAARLWRQWR
jgi:hypothetical protein